MKIYAALWPNHGSVPLDGEEVLANGPDDLVDNDGVLILWGGEDISPSVYNERPGSRTGAGPELSRRDRSEIALAKRAIDIGLPILGICRGAQLMCALSGGKLVQHVTGHGLMGGHDIMTDDGQTITANSLHHQMMFPWGIEHKLIAWSAPSRSEVYLGEDDRPLIEASQHPEPEVVYFPKTKTLAIQGHPEFISNIKNPFVKFSVEKVHEYLYS